jgi:DNA-binding response OmpR family regulator
MAQHILIVDDDALMRHSLAFSLQQAGYQTLSAGTAEDARAIVQTRPLNAILLDIGLPDIDGVEALRMFQRIVSVPIIFVTARRRELDEIVGLQSGADDYITKPFDTDVLIAHLKAVLRRSARQAWSDPYQQIAVGDVRIDPASHSVRVGTRDVDLPPKEFEILLALAREKDRVLSVDDLLTRIWGAEWVGESQTVYVHIRWLREKIEEDPAHPRRLITVKGAGYKFVPAAV